MSQVKINELLAKRILAPLFNPWLVSVFIFNTPVAGLYDVPEIAVNSPVPPDCIDIPLVVARLNIWIPIKVWLLALNWLLISSINSTLAVAILNRSLIFLFWKLINLDNPVRIVVSVAKS